MIQSPAIEKSGPRRGTFSIATEPRARRGGSSMWVQSRRFHVFGRVVGTQSTIVNRDEVIEQNDGMND